MKIATIIARVLLGLAFVVFGANMLVPFLPMPPPVEGSLPAQFMAVMWPTHYMKLVGVFQLLGGAFVLSGCLTPLGLCFLAPVSSKHSSVSHFFLELERIAGGLVFSVLEAFLIYYYRENFKGILCWSSCNEKSA